MCGIFAYSGSKDPLTTCVKGLKWIESRGYDSAGIAWLNEGKILHCKKKGSVDTLIQSLQKEERSSLRLAISHTRWATHGKANDANAHPHLDESDQFAIVHNGIIENYADLKKSLLKSNKAFSSDTDTEVIVQLIRHQYDGDSLKAFSSALQTLKGSYAIVLIDKDRPDALFAAAKESPLAIGYDKDHKEYFLSSDPNAFLGKNLEVTFLKERQIALIEKGFLHVYTEDLKPIAYEMKKFVKNQTDLPSKQGFPHYMLKEIYDQPAILEKMLQKRLKGDFAVFEELHQEKGFLSTIDQIVFIGCGTSYHASKLAADLYEETLSISTRAEISSEIRFKHFTHSKNTLMIALSQSGETADTLAAIKEAKKKGIKTLAVCNIAHSSLTRESHSHVLLEAGPEISVCSTKAFTSQMALMMLLALFLGELQNRPFLKKNALIEALKKAPLSISEILSKRAFIDEIADRYAFYKHFLFIGRKLMHTVSLELALKLQEISYVNAHAYAAGELKHGPLALIDEHLPIIALCGNRETLVKTQGNLSEAKARGAPILAILPEHNSEIEKIADHVIVLPESVNDYAMIFSTVLIGQLLSYRIAHKKGRPIDQPRNLAKCVTVE